MLLSFDCARRLHPALPIPNHILARSANRRIEPLTGGRDLELLVTSLIGLQRRTDERFADIAFPQSVAFLLEVKLLVHIQLCVTALEAKPKMFVRPEHAGCGV